MNWCDYRNAKCPENGCDCAVLVEEEELCKHGVVEQWCSTCEDEEAEESLGDSRNES